MERDGDLLMDTHEWNHIMRGAIPASIAVAIVFVNMTSNWKLALFLCAMAGAYLLVSMKTKKKGDIFTALAIVFLTALAVHFLQGAGLL